MSETLIAMPAAMMERLICALEKLSGVPAQSTPSAGGLLTYDEVAVALSATGKALSRRQVERLQKKNPSILRKVPLGSRTVRFRPCDVEKLKAHLAGEPNSGRQL